MRRSLLGSLTTTARPMGHAREGGGLSRYLLGIGSFSACSWLVLVGSLKACTPLPGRAAETRLDLSGFVWICPGVRISRGWISGCPDIQSGYVRICLDMSGYVYIYVF